ncbi:DUF2059 domain-containing protein [Endozoicomonas sp. Mp262]|uniref:DUF2059 domain-containing protein n=1 Tax=Endozoicomonas sp. Mp262 TaxID=2919499 RepID=UPI0021DB48BA
MIDKKGFFVVLGVLLLAASAAPASDKGVLLDELYEQAQLERQLNWIKSSMTLDYSEYTLPDKVLDTVNQVVRVRYSPLFFRVSMMNTLDEALTVDELLALVEWYNSPLGQKILKLETIANNPFNAPRIQAYIEERLSRQLPRSSRTALIEELMVALDVVEHGTELAATASVGARRILLEVMPVINEGARRPPQALKAREKPAIRRTMSERMKSIFFYTYRSLSDQEIRRYLEFARSSAMQNFQRGQVLAIGRML